MNDADCQYILFASGRCGSTFFARTLESYGLGFPVEIRSLAKTKDLLSSNPIHFYRKHDRRIWSLKVKPYNLLKPGRLVVKTRDIDIPIDVSPTGDILNLKYIYMQRLDKIQNGIARYVAKTKQMTLGDSQRNIYAESDREVTDWVPYDFEKIHSAIEMERTRHSNFIAYFKEMGIVPLHVFYEEVLENIANVLDIVTTYLGVSSLTEPDATVPIPLRLEDEKTAALTYRYKQECMEKGIYL